MTKAFISEVLRESCEITQIGSRAATIDLIGAIVEKIKRDGKFVLPGFGTFTLVKTRAYTGMNPRSGEKVKVKAGKTVRFKVSPALRRRVTASSQKRNLGKPATSAGRRSGREVLSFDSQLASD